MIDIKAPHHPNPMILMFSMMAEDFFPSVGNQMTQDQNKLMQKPS